MSALFTPEFGLVFWMLVVFLILLLILGKYAWPGIIKNIDERAAYIDKGVEFTRTAEEEKERTKAESRKLLDQAYQQQMDIMDQTERMRKELVEDARKEAAKEAKRVVETARISVEQLKRESEQQIKKQVAILSMQIAEKVLRQNLANETAQMELIGKLLNEIESNE